MIDHSTRAQEFGITKALNWCESNLRAQLPSAEQPLAAPLTPMFNDEDMLVLSMDDAAEPLVLSRAAGEFDVAKRRRG